MTTKSASHWFEGFDAAKQAELQEEARQRWGAETVDAAKRARQGQVRPVVGTGGRQWLAILDALVKLIDAGKAPATSRCWTCRRALPLDHPVLDAQPGVLPGPRPLYTDDPRFRANYDRPTRGSPSS
jgi:hypothetical protein